MQHPWLVALFVITILMMMLLDLGVLNRRSHAISNREAILWSLIWVGLSMLFSVLVLWQTGLDKFAQFQTCYWIEKALSVDNLFVFILVFGFFNVPPEVHHKVLFWGILGAIILRAFFIFSGAWLIELTYLPPLQLFGQNLEINVVMTLFGVFLIYAGYKSWFVNDEDDQERDFNKSPGARIVHRFFRVSDNFDADRFFTLANGTPIATPLLVVVGVIEFTDLMFAVDSIPAIFAITKDPFILYTSNIFAILGLRSLYFLLANFIQRFRLLKYGLALILSFIGIKMVVAQLGVHISPPVSLSFVVTVLVTSAVISLAICKPPANSSA
jgi:tellurite resistance protein TerC